MEFTGVVKESAPAYIAGRADNTIRNRLLLMLLARYGRIKLNASSHKQYWDVKRGQHLITSYGDDGTIDFTRSDLYEQLFNDWRAYKGGDRLTEMNRLMLGGMTGIIDRYENTLDDMLDSLQDNFCGELIKVDGNLPANVNRVHGLETIFSYDNGAGNVVAADRVCKPNDTYGGQSTAVGVHNTTPWTSVLTTKPSAAIGTDWPSGSGPSDYDWNAPKIVRWNADSWGTGSTAWEDNCERVIDQTIIWMTQTGGRKGRPTLFLLDGDLYWGYEQKVREKYRIYVPHKEANDLGFPDVLNQSGVAIQYDFDVPAQTGYGLNIYQMCLESLDTQLFSSRGPQYDIRSDSYLFLVGFFGNVRYNAKHFSKILNAPTT